MGVKYSAEWWQRVSLTRGEPSPHQQNSIVATDDVTCKDRPTPPDPAGIVASLLHATTRIGARSKD
jgi:hypothetical protein